MERYIALWNMSADGYISNLVNVRIEFGKYQIFLEFL